MLNFWSGRTPQGTVVHDQWLFWFNNRWQALEKGHTHVFAYITDFCNLVYCLPLTPPPCSGEPYGRFSQGSDHTCLHVWGRPALPNLHRNRVNGQRSPPDDQVDSRTIIVVAIAIYLIFVRLVVLSIIMSVYYDVLYSKTTINYKNLMIWIQYMKRNTELKNYCYNVQVWSL